MSPAEVLKLVKERDSSSSTTSSSIFWSVAAHHHAIHRLKEESFSEGFGFDGSSIRGWKASTIRHDLCSDASTACVDPFFKEPTLSLICDIVDAVTHQPMTASAISPEGEAHIKQIGLGDSVYLGPEPEFSSSTRSVSAKGRTTFYK